MNVKLKKLACSALISAAAVLAAPAAHADLITFENVTNVVKPGLNAGDSTYIGGQAFNDSGFSFAVQQSAYFQSLGINGLSGAIVDGANPFNCAILVCPSGNPTSYFAGLYDGAVSVARQGSSGFFSLSSLNFGFIAPVPGLPDGVFGQLRLNGLLTDGTTVSITRDFPGQDSNGNFLFDTWNLDPSFAALHLSAVTIDACLFDGQGNCLNDAINTAFGQAQFAIDDLAVSVPLPGTAPLVLLGMAGLAFARRRRAAQ